MDRPVHFNFPSVMAMDRQQKYISSERNVSYRCGAWNVGRRAEYFLLKSITAYFKNCICTKMRDNL